MWFIVVFYQLLIQFSNLAKIQLYDHPGQFEPLMPGEHRLAPLLALAHSLERVTSELALFGAPPELLELLRGMNSYYTNRIEGEHTRPAEIAQALRKNFSGDEALAKKQRLAIAHMDTEAALEARFSSATEAGMDALYSAEAVCTIHSELFGRLPAGDLFTNQGEPISPGSLRQRDVSVGRHVAPTHGSLPVFLARWAGFYGGVRAGEASLLAALCAHHRLSWIHPFVDGNGRVARLHTHTTLHALGYTRGLWSPLRGFARSTSEYFARLDDADSPRKGDLDGRGNLSEQALLDWLTYALNLCVDQARFMQQLLRPTEFVQRIQACLLFEQSVRKSGVRVEALRPLHYLWLTGQGLSRGDFKSMMPLGERIATDTLSALVSRGLLVSDTPQGKVRCAVPHHALRFLFPALWPEAEADAEIGV